MANAPTQIQKEPTEKKPSLSTTAMLMKDMNQSMHHKTPTYQDIAFERGMAQTKTEIIHQETVLKNPFMDIQQLLQTLEKSKKASEVYNRYYQEYLPLKEEGLIRMREVDELFRRYKALNTKKNELFIAAKNPEELLKSVKQLQKEFKDFKNDFEKLKLNAGSLLNQLKPIENGLEQAKQTFKKIKTAIAPAKPERS